MLNTKFKTLKLDYFSYIRAFFNLMKPRVMSLVIFTCAVGLLIAPTKVNFFDAMLSLFAVALGSGAAGALNMWYEADLDKLMTRTCLRPIPTGKINRNHALIFGILLSIISVSGLYFYANFISAALLFLTIFFYLFIYTIWLKRLTPQNIVIGGASGALPPVIGWTIATNALTLEPFTFFLIIFYWTPSHFWALSLYKAKDYEKAKIPMLPITDGIEQTKKKIFVYSLFMLPIVVIPYYIGFVGELFLIFSLILTFYYNYVCYDLFKFKKNKFEIKKAKKVFSYSIFYLFLIFVLFLIDQVI